VIWASLPAPSATNNPFRVATNRLGLVMFLRTALA
jgi:hypothetical protein